MDMEAVLKQAEKGSLHVLEGTLRSNLSHETRDVYAVRPWTMNGTTFEVLYGPVFRNNPEDRSDRTGRYRPTSAPRVLGILARIRRRDEKFRVTQMSYRQLKNVEAERMLFEELRRDGHLDDTMDLIQRNVQPRVRRAAWGERDDEDAYLNSDLIPLRRRLEQTESL